jgi:hypothetical protein
MPETYEEQEQRLLDSRHDRRMKREARDRDRVCTTLDRKERGAEPLVGELQGERGHRFYINVRSATGRLTGRIREFPRRHDAVAYLIRNNYV